MKLVLEMVIHSGVVECYLSDTTTPEPVGAFGTLQTGGACK